jgi:hypothetical protein
MTSISTGVSAEKRRRQWVWGVVLLGLLAGLALNFVESSAGRAAPNLVFYLLVLPVMAGLGMCEEAAGGLSRRVALLMRAVPLGCLVLACLVGTGMAVTEIFALPLSPESVDRMVQLYRVLCYVYLATLSLLGVVAMPSHAPVLFLAGLVLFSAWDTRLSIFDGPPDSWSGLGRLWSILGFGISGMLHNLRRRQSETASSG